MYWTYIIRSQTTRKYYIGSSENLEKRLKRHNSGYTKSIRNKGPFNLIYSESFPTRKDAYRREKEIKSYKGGEAFKRLANKEKTLCWDGGAVKRTSLPPPLAGCRQRRHKTVARHRQMAGSR